MRIVFMGTPEFSIPSLDILRTNGHDIVGVVTAVDKPSGRGLKLRPSPVKAYALEHNLKVLQPTKLRDPDFLQELEALRPDLMVVVAFRMLPEVVWSIPSKGTFNLHASLLPDYRGAAPINWVIINGETRTGATTFFIDHQIDTGNLLLQRELDIPPDWTAGDLHDSLMEVGAGLVLETVNGIDAGELKAYPQDDSLYKNKAPKIKKEDCIIEWNQQSDRVYNFIRGLSPYPAARTTLNGEVFKVFAAAKTEGKEAAPAGTLAVSEDHQQLFVAVTDGWLELKTVQLAGKKRMSAAQFLNGYKEELHKLGTLAQSET